MDDDVFKMKSDLDRIKEKVSNYDDLTRSVNSLNRIFEEASAELKLDAHDAVLVSEKLDKILNGLEKIEIQNEKIAKGIVALADMIEDLNRSRPLPQSRPASGITISPPPSPNPPGVKPLPGYNLPKQEEKKRNFLSF